ncbi:MAG: hypothetical protein EXR94_14605 [Gemmatimonadetes bacterium]|nr:hypothetical protein [Gemmatimonadota bacterium]
MTPLAPLLTCLFLGSAPERGTLVVTNMNDNTAEQRRQHRGGPRHQIRPRCGYAPGFRISVPAENVLTTTEFPGSASPEGVTAGADGFVYITLQGRNQAAAIDLATGKIPWHLPVGAWSDGIAYAKAR